MSGVATKPIIFNGPMARAIQEKRKTQTRRILSPQNLRIWTGGLDFDGRYVRPDEAMMTAALNNARGFRFIEGLLSWQADCVPNQAGVLSQWLGKLTINAGDLLWVREAWRSAKNIDHMSPRQMAAECCLADYCETWAPLRYEADGVTRFWDDDWPCQEPGRLRPSIHMPRWASRTTLTVTDVRVERLQEIHERDAIAEGAPVVGTCRITGAPMCKTDHPASHVTPCLWFRRLWNSLHGPDAWDRNDWVLRIAFTPHLDNDDHLIADLCSELRDSERPENGVNT